MNLDPIAEAKIAELRAERDAYAERVDDLESHLCGIESGT